MVCVNRASYKKHTNTPFVLTVSVIRNTHTPIVLKRASYKKHTNTPFVLTVSVIRNTETHRLY